MDVLAQKGCLEKQKLKDIDLCEDCVIGKTHKVSLVKQRTSRRTSLITYTQTCGNNLTFHQVLVTVNNSSALQMIGPKMCGFTS